MTETIREKLSQMRQIVKTDPEGAASFVCEKDRILSCLSHEDPKVRKNAALLLGMLPWDEDKPQILMALYDAYENEETLYVRPSYIKGMRTLGEPLSAEMRLHLKERVKKLSVTKMDEEEKKHLTEERRMLLSLLQNAGFLHSFNGISERVPLLLTSEEEYIPYLMKELEQRGVPHSDIRRTPFGIRVMSEELSSILSARLYDKIYFIVPIKRGDKLTEDSLRETLIHSMLSDLLSRYLSGEDPIPFRVNVRLKDGSPEKTGALQKKIAGILEEIYNGRLYNAPGNYEIELLFGQREDQSFGLFLWFAAYKDMRFSYRKESAATSMSGHKAAAMIEMLYPYLKEGGLCLDPLCGTGMLLIERGMVKPPAKTFGTEVYASSVAAAKENAAEADAAIHFIQKDYFDFTYDGTFDEIITEFPDLFHKEKEEKILFLRRFFETSTRLTAKGAIWGILTGEENLFKQQIRLTKGLTLVETIPFGGRRTLYICRRGR